MSSNKKASSIACPRVKYWMTNNCDGLHTLFLFVTQHTLRQGWYMVFFDIIFLIENSDWILSLFPSIALDSGKMKCIRNASNWTRYNFILTPWLLEPVAPYLLTNYGQPHRVGRTVCPVWGGGRLCQLGLGWSGRKHRSHALWVEIRMDTLIHVISCMF